MNVILRFVWFLLIGWWLGLIWFVMSFIAILTIVFSPMGIYSITKTWKIMTLEESPKSIIVNVENHIHNK